MYLIFISCFLFLCYVFFYLFNFTADNGFQKKFPIRDVVVHDNRKWVRHSNRKSSWYVNVGGIVYGFTM